MAPLQYALLFRIISFIIPQTYVWVVSRAILKVWQNQGGRVGGLDPKYLVWPDKSVMVQDSEIPAQPQAERDNRAGCCSR